MHIFYQQARSDFAKKSGFHYAKSFHNLLFWLANMAKTIASIPTNRRIGLRQNRFRFGF